jgi:muramidase (phage lysozyme)
LILNIPLKKLDVHSQAVAKALGMGARSANDHAKTLKGLITNQKALGAETKRIRAEIGAYRAAIGFAGASNKAFGDSARKSVAELKAMDRALRGMRIRAFGSDLRATSTRIQKIGKDAQFVGRSLMINLTAPLTLFARVGFQQLIAVDKELVRLTKVLDNVALSADQANRKLGAGSTPKQVQGLTDAFTSLNNELTKISSNYGVSKQLVVGLASDFAELGLTGHESILALTELTAQIEKLGAMDISGAQDLTQALYFQSVRAYENTGAFEGMTNAIDREALAVKAATTQMQLFNAIENVTALTLKDLGQAFPEVASMAVSMGLSMTEAAAMLAPMKAAGLDVGASANSIKVSLQRALSPTTKNIKILKALAESFGEAGDKSSAFATANKTGLTGLQSITEIFDKVMASKGGMEGALKLMSNLFEKRQGPRMFLAIEQLSLFNKELNIATRSSTSAEGLLAGVAESALKEFNTLNKTALPETVNNFKDIGIIARIATAHSGQMVEGFGKVNSAQIKTAKEARKAVADRILLEKQTEGRDVISEVRTETGRAMLIELAGASNAADVANAELAESLKALSVVTERLKNNFKLFAADILKAVVPMLQNLSKKVQDLMNRWNNSTQEFRDRVSKVITIIVAFLAALGPVVLAIGTMQAVTGVLGRSIAVFIPKLATETGAFIGLGNAIRGATGSLAAHNAVQNKSYLGAIKNKMFGKADMRTPASAIKELTEVSASRFGAGYNPIQRITPTREAKILDEQQFQSFRRLNPKGSRAPMKEQLKIFKESKRISEKIATSGAFSLTPKEAAFQTKNALKIASVPTAMSQGATAATPIIARKKQIFDSAATFAQKGIMTDADGTKFFAKSGREISEKRAQQLATGQMAGRIGLAKDTAMSGIKDVGVKGKKLGKGFLDAVNPVKQYRSAINGARVSMAALDAQNKLYPLAAQGGFAKARAAVKGFTKGIKLANIAMKILRMTMIASGIGAIILLIGVAVYAVMKNFDKFKEAAKPALDALSQAFFVIKNAAIEVIRPIFDLFAAFGKGAEGGAGAAQGIGAIFAKLAGVIEFVGSVVSSFLTDIVKPVFQSITNIVMFVVSIFKGAWGDAFGYLLAALSFLGKAFINFWKLLYTATISIVTGLAKGIVSLLLQGIVNGLIQGVLLALRGLTNLIGKLPFAKGLADQINNGLKNAGGAVSSALSSATKGINSVIDAGGNLAKKGVNLIADNINKVLDAGTKKGIKQSTGNLLKGKSSITGAGKELGEAGGEAIANAMGDAAGTAADKAGKAIKDGIKDAAQRLQDFVRNAFKSALDKMIDATVSAMKKQKEAGLKVFDVQLKTLEKLEKAEESLTKTKEYQQNLRKILDDRDLNRANYIRNRALAIYEGRVDDARMLDLEQQGAETSSVADETSLNDSRRKDLAAENLAALRTAIAEAKEKAGELFDLQIEAFQKAAADIIKIGPVTIEQYAVMQKELETLANTSSSTMTQQFGDMFEKFTTTVADKMPNQVVGAFSTGLDLLVAEARTKYGLGDNADENTIIGVTLGMLTSIGDKMGEGGPSVVAAFGTITTDLHSNFTEAKDVILTDVQDAFLKPFKKAFDDADPTAVFNQAIKDGNAQMLRDFENTLELNKALMDKMAKNLDPAILKYIQLKAAIDAANDAASGGGGAGDGAGFTGNVKNLPNLLNGMSPDTYLAALAAGKRAKLPTTILKENAARARVSQLQRTARGAGEYETGGYIPAPTQQGVPAILHGGEYVINAKAVNRIGLGALEKMNNNLLPRFYKGGRVPGGSADTMERRMLGKSNAPIKSIGKSNAPIKSKGDNFVENAIFAATTLSNYKKLPGALGNMASSVAQSFNTAGAGLLNAISSVAEIGKKDKSLNPLTNFIRRQEGGRNAPLNPARGLGFQDKSGMFNIAKDSYLGNMEAFDVATSFPLFKGVGVAAKAALKTGISKQILGKIGLLDSGLTAPEVIKPAFSALFRRPVASTVATQITSQVAKQQFRAQEVLDQLPRQLSATPRMLELMPGPGVQQVMPSVPALVERINGAIPLPRAGVGVELPKISLEEYLLHGGPKPEQLIGGVINPDFIRGGSLWNIIARSKQGASIGRTSIGMDDMSVLAGSEQSQNQKAMAVFHSVMEVITNAKKHGVHDYVETPIRDNFGQTIFHSPTDSYKFDKAKSRTMYKWGEQIEWAQNWLKDNAEIIRRVQSGEVHSTGVPVSYANTGAYEYGAVHLLNVPKKLNTIVGGRSRFQGITYAPDGEIPFWGMHEPIASAVAFNENNRQVRLKAYQKLINAMIEHANKNMTPKQLADFEFSQRVYGNEITPAARQFILDEFNRKNFHVGNPEHIQKLLGMAGTKGEMKASLAEVARKYPRGHSQATDTAYDNFKTIFEEIIDQFASPRIIDAEELRIQAHLASTIHSGVDGMMLGVADKVGMITYGDAIKNYEKNEAMRSLLENIPENLHQHFFDSLAGIPQNKEAVLSQFNNFNTMPVAKLQELAKSIDLSKIGNFSTPVLEQVMDPALEAKKAAFLQARGMGGSGAGFNNISEFLSTLGGADGPASRLFVQLRQLTSAQQEKKPGLLGINRALTNLYADTGSKALGFTSMAKSGSSVDLDVYRRSLMMKSQGYDNNRGMPGIALLTQIPFTKEIKTLLNSNETRSSIGLDEIPAKHLAAVMNILVRQFDQTIEEFGTVLPKDILAFRGLGIPEGASDPLDYFNQIYQPGRATAPSYRSASLAKHMAQGFTEVTNKVPTLENIIIPAGTKALMPGVFGIGPMHERELILPRNMQFLADRIEEKQNLMQVYGKMIKGTTAGAGLLGAMGFAGGDKAYAAPTSESQKYQEYLKQIRSLSEFIAGGESLNVKDPYSAWYGGKQMMMPDMTSMTINDVIANANSRAVGKYQNMPKYLLERARLANLSGSDLYSESAQEAIMMATLLEKSPVSLGLKDYMAGKMSTNTAVNKIARTWLSMPQLGGQYVGTGANPKGFDRQRKDLVIKAYLNRIKNLYPGFKTGGYVPGSPSMPFPAILHGGEYVVSADAVRNMGVETMRNINQSKFRTPSGTPSYQGRGQATTVSTVNINVDTFIGEEEWFKGMMKDYSINILPRMQKNAGNETRSFTTYNGLNQ